MKAKITVRDALQDSDAATLCTNCGLCCYALNNNGLVADESERGAVEGFGGELFIGSMGQLSFVQPCPAFDGVCTVYPNHPASCKSYRCKLLDDMLNERLSLARASVICEKIIDTVRYIDESLSPLMGVRTVIVEDYVAAFLKQTTDDRATRDKYKEVRLQFGVYRYLRARYFDH